jgi:hypothetical protein
MTIPNWARQHLQQKINEGSVSYNDLGEKVKKIIKPLPKSAPVDYGDSSLAELSAMQSETPVKEIQAPAFESLPKSPDYVEGGTLSTDNTPNIGEAFKQGMYNSLVSKIAEKVVEGITKQPIDWSYDTEQTKKYKPQGAVENIASMAGGMVQDAPLFLAGQGIVGNPITKTVLQKGLPKITAKTLGATATGAAMGGTEAVVERQPLPEALKTIGTSAATWGGAELGLGALGAGVKALRKTDIPKIEGLNLTSTKQISKPIPKTLSMPNYTQKAMDDLNAGIETAQNYVKHNDVLAAYPPGTTIEQAYADIKQNTGVDLFKLVDNVEKAQSIPGLKQTIQQQAQYASLRKAVGLMPENIGRTGKPVRVIGNQKPQESLPVINPPISQPVINQPVPQPILQPQKAGVYDPGTIGAAKLTIPEKGSVIPGTGEKVRSFQVSAAKAPITQDETKAGLLVDIYPGGAGAYNPVKLSEVDTNAKALVNTDTEKAFRFVSEEKEPSALHTATGIRLIEKFQNENNYDRAIDIAESLAEKLTKQGQAISAARIMGALKPDGVLVFAQRQINKINNQTKLKIFGLGKDVKLDSETAANLKKLAETMQNAKDENLKIEAAQDLQAALQALKPSSIGRKIATTQTIAQLYNPKTQIRNILGNEIFYRLERINKYIATPIDWTRSKLTGSEREITFSTPGQGGYWKGFLQGAKAGWKGVNVKGLQTQYDLGHGLTFNPNGNPAERFMSFLERSLGAAMKGFDTAAYNRAYNQTLGELATLRAINQFGKADKATVQKLINEIDINLMDIADQYGKYVTFQDNNLISKGLIWVKRGLNVGQDFGFGDLVLKYPKTPGALLARGLEYSPAGFLKAAFQIAKPYLTKTAPNPREATLALSRAITGTVGLTGTGYFLADVGIITGSAEKDKDLRELQRQTGTGQYKVNLGALRRWVLSGFDPEAAKPKQGDFIISYDWAQPVAMSISAGANIYQNIENKQEILSGLDTTIAGSFEGAINTVAQQPVLQGITRLFQGYDLGENVSQTLKGIPSSFTPTLANQVKQLTDNTGRVTYDPSIIKESLNMAVNKVPGLNKTLPVAYDTFGKPKETYQNESNNIFNVMLNPSFVARYNVTPNARLVLQTFEQTGETNQIPRSVDESITVSGNKFELTPDEFSEFQRIVGEKTDIGFSRISENTRPEAQIKKMVEVLNDAGQAGKLAILKQRGLNVKKKGQGVVLK